MREASLSALGKTRHEVRPIRSFKDCIYRDDIGLQENSVIACIMKKVTEVTFALFE